MNTQSLISRLLFADRGSRWFICVLVVVGIGLPLAHLLLPAASPLHPSTYTLGLVGKYMTYALLAIAIDLIWGYGGILSLGHTAFFALGGYAMGMYLMRQIGPRGVYGDPLLPDFMVFLNWDQLPWYWLGMDMFWFAMAMVVVVPGLLAFVFGWLAFRSRVAGVYFSIISQALTYALLLAFFRNEMGFGGNNGLTDFKELLGFDLQASSTRVGLFIASAIALGLGFIACRFIVTSRFGRVIAAIRDAEGRARFIGYRVERYQVWLFTWSAMLAGVAGALYVPQVGIINPGEFAPLNAIEAVVWVAVGGRGTLYGAVVGAVAVNWLKTYFTQAWPEAWLYALGALFVLVTLFLPQGLVGLAGKLRDGGLRWRRTGDMPSKQDGPVKNIGERNSAGTNSAAQKGVAMPVATVNSDTPDNSAVQGAN